ncbi:MAG: helix-turn-helix domain-containing protein [Lachnospiraceae bacterium]|nr:helix-turn-helix domain-containing protein [Lachnospiraceae bacterium]
MSKFSERFRQLKTECGMTLKELSQDLDITVPNLSYYMKGREPSYDVLIRIADYFNVTTDWLIGRTGERTSVQGTLVSDIENTLHLNEENKLDNSRRTAYLECQQCLYQALVETYQFFSLIDHKTYKLIINAINHIYEAISLYIQTMKIACMLPTEENIIEMMHNESSISCDINTLISQSTNKLINLLAYSDGISEESRRILLELSKVYYVNSTHNSFNNDKDVYLDVARLNLQIFETEQKIIKTKKIPD